MRDFQRLIKEGLLNMISDVYQKKFTNEVKLLHNDFIQIYSKYTELNDINILGQNSFMEKITSNETYCIFIINNIDFFK